MWRRVILSAIVTVTIAASVGFAFHVMPRTRDGSSVRRAVRLEGPDMHARSQKEEAWLKEHGPDFYALRWMHSIIAENGWLYSRWDLETPSGHKEIYFDLQEREPRE